LWNASQWVYDHTLISSSLTSISPSLTSILPSLAHLTIIEKLHRLSYILPDRKGILTRSVIFSMIVKFAFKMWGHFQTGGHKKTLFFLLGQGVCERNKSTIMGICPLKKIDFFIKTFTKLFSISWFQQELSRHPAPPPQRRRRWCPCKFRNPIVH